jgi:hypothetical protein
MCRDGDVRSVVDMTTYPPTFAPAPPRATAAGATAGTLWVLRIVSGIQAVLLLAQPILAGRFLDGDFPSLSTHGANGLALMGLAWLVVIAAVLAWRPGRLPAWPVAVSVACAFLLPIQLGMGHARLLAVHLILGVALVAAGVAVAIWAWRPGRARRSYRAPRVPHAPSMLDGGAQYR